MAVQARSVLASAALVTAIIATPLLLLAARGCLDAEKHTLSGNLHVAHETDLGDATCGSATFGAVVLVRDELGTVLAHGELSSGRVDLAASGRLAECKYEYRIHGITPARLYTIQFGEEDPIEFHFKPQELERSNWRIDLRHVVRQRVVIDPNDVPGWR